MSVIYRVVIGDYRISVIERVYTTYEGIIHGEETMVFKNDTNKMVLLYPDDCSEMFAECKTNEDVEKVVEILNKT